MFRASYSYEVDGDIIAIIDNDKGRSVTNDAENVIQDLVERGWEVDKFLVIYRDTMGVWDRLVTRDGKFSHFASVNERTYEAAAEKARRLFGAKAG